MNSVLQQVAIPAVMQRANASGLFVSLCTIQQPDGLFIDAGQPSGNFVNVTPNDTWQANTLYDEGQEIAVTGTLQRCTVTGLSGPTQPRFSATPGVTTADGEGALLWVCETLAMTNIPCTAPPTSNIRITANEKKAIDRIETFSSLHVLLNGYYPGIEYGTGKGWRAMVDGYPFDILGAEHDSQRQMTRLAVRFSAT